MSGAAADYYSGNPSQNQYQPQMDPYKSQPGPPSYGKPNNNDYPPPNEGAPYPPDPENYVYNSNGGDKTTFEEAFKVEKPKWNDLWAGILMIAVMIGYFAVCGMSLKGYSNSHLGNGIYDGNQRFGLGGNTLILFVFVVSAATLLSFGYLFLANKFTKTFIWISGILNIVSGFVTALYMLSRRYWSGGMVFLIFSVFAVICFISWIPRIPFSVLMLQTTVDVSKRVGHVYIVSWIGGLTALIFSLLYSATLVSIYVKYQPGNDPSCRQDGRGCSNGKVIGFFIFTTFAMYWLSEYIKNTIRTVISGVYGAWYFCSKNSPKGVTRGAFKRAVTYSFGSVSFGSLVVAIISTVRQLVQIAQSSATADDNIIGTICFCLLGCVIDLLNWAAEFFNRFAFVHIALYGKAYIPAAKDTWRMIKNRGVDALVNQCLIGPVTSMGATFVGYTCALLGYLYLLFTKPEYNKTGSYTPAIVGIAFVIGLQICNIVTTPINAGIDTIFVAMSWDPAVMQRDHPELWAKMITVYPQVQNSLMA